MSPPSSLQSCSLSLQLATHFEDCPVNQEEWDEAVERLGGPIYMTFDWLRTWMGFYGHGAPLRLYVIRCDGAIVGLLPFYVEKFGYSPLVTRVARLVGANIPPKAFNPPLHPNHARDALSLALQDLFENEKCDLLSLGPVSKAWPAENACREFLSGLRADGFQVAWVSRDVQTLFNLPDSLDGYLASLPPSERANRRRRLRQLDKLGMVSTTVVTETARLEDEFEIFARHHAAQWEAAGLGGHFAAWPRGHEFHRALIHAQGNLGRVQFHRITLDGQLVANRYTYAWGNTLFSELPSRAVGDPWDKIGLGGTAYVKMFEAAIAAGIHRIDSGLGRYDNKVLLGGIEVEAGVWRVWRNGWSGVKARLILLVSSCVSFFCHKLWYRRILPKMTNRVKRRQALWWLRFDM